MRPRRPRRALTIAELERRAVPAFTATLIGGDEVTFSGSAAAETLVLSLSVDGSLQHNRFAAGGAGFVSPVDLDSSSAGVQALQVGAVDRITVNADGGNDFITAAGLFAAVRLNGNDGDDTLVGGGGDDILSGNAGDDSLVGGEGDDTLNGAANNDVLRGGTGTDVLDGGLGADTAIAGEIKTNFP